MRTCSKITAVQLQMKAASSNGACEAIFTTGPVSSEISDLLLFVSYFTSQSEGIKFGDYFFDVCCVSQNVVIRCQTPTTSLQYGNDYNH